MDIISKVKGKTKAFDSMTMIKARIMEVIILKIKANWVRCFFKRIREVIMKIEAYMGSFSQKPMFGILISNLLASKGIEMKKKTIAEILVYVQGQHTENNRHRREKEWEAICCY